MEGWKNLDRWVGIVALVLGILGIVLVNEARENLEKGFQAYGKTLLLFLVGTALLAISVTALWRTRGLRNIEKQYRELTTTAKDLQTKLKQVTLERDAVVDERDKLVSQHSDCIRYQKYPRGRWESLQTITFGHVGYAPFLTYDKGNPKGIGLDLLRQLLAFPVRGNKIDLLPFDYECNWKNVLHGLVEGKYDIVATPLFATFDRSKEVGFTAPLFFSNIGLYVRSDVASMSFWKDITVETLKEKIQAAINLRFLAVDGEISQQLARKHADPNQIEELSGETILAHLFNRIANTANPPCAAFCESFFAHFQEHVRTKRVENILPPHQILYPVCFATRIGDYQLRNLLNIRLLEMTRSGAVLDLLEKELNRETSGGLTPEDVKQHFIAQWPYPIAQETAAHA